jgi:hypothetical protein
MLHPVTGVYYAGGGGGSTQGSSPIGRAGLGGIGGGGDGAYDPTNTAVVFGNNGNVNTGGGGGGGADSPLTKAGNGGDGVVILSYPTGAGVTANNTTGSNVVYVNDGANHIYKFYASGTITF